MLTSDSEERSDPGVEEACVVYDGEAAPVTQPHPGHVQQRPNLRALTITAIFKVKILLDVSQCYEKY